MESVTHLKNNEVVFEKQQESEVGKPISNYDKLVEFIRSNEIHVEITPEEYFEGLSEGLKDFIKYNEGSYY